MGRRQSTSFYHMSLDSLCIGRIRILALARVVWGVSLMCKEDVPFWPTWKLWKGECDSAAIDSEVKTPKVATTIHTRILYNRLHTPCRIQRRLPTCFTSQRS